jgi:hypothetical protein
MMVFDAGYGVVLLSCFTQGRTRYKTMRCNRQGKVGCVFDCDTVKVSGGMALCIPNLISRWRPVGWLRTMAPSPPGCS